MVVSCLDQRQKNQNDSKCGNVPDKGAQQKNACCVTGVFGFCASFPIGGAHLFGFTPGGAPASTRSSRMRGNTTFSSSERADRLADLPERPGMRSTVAIAIS